MIFSPFLVTCSFLWREINLNLEWWREDIAAITTKFFRYVKLELDSVRLQYTQFLNNICLLQAAAIYNTGVPTK